MARVVAKNSHSMILELVQTEKCEGCPANCNKPLIDIFSLRKNLFKISNREYSYELVDGDDVLSDAELLGQIIRLKFDNNDLMVSSALLYMLPLAVVLVFLSLGHYLGIIWQFSTDSMALTGLILGLIAVYFFARKIKRIQHLIFRPKVTILSISGT